MSTALNIIGSRYGRLIAVRRVQNTRQEKAQWLCRCDCGNETIVPLAYLRKGATKSCGCFRRQLIGDRLRTHGLTRTPTWTTWRAMKARCSNPQTNGFHNYGGRGICVCDRWSKFENFVADMGERPSLDFSIDRLDTNGNYTPENCRWATIKQQRRNKRQQ